MHAAPASQDPEGGDEQPPSRRRALVVGAVVLLALLALNGAYQASRAVQAGTRGKNALLQAENDVSARKPSQARRQLVEARTAFRQVHRHLVAMGPLLPLARIVPFVRIQTRGVEAFAGAGVALADAGIGLTESASAVVEPSDEHVPVSGALDSLRTVHASLERAVKALRSATDRVAALDGYRLVGPIGSARAQLVTRIPDVAARAVSAEQGLHALIVFAGDSGPRRYLFFSQNPDEIRPTGGFIGTYGVLEAGAGQLTLDRFEPIEAWQSAHPDAVVPADLAPSALRFSAPPSHQSLANVNATPDFPAAAKLAAELWRKGGEAPVDGVVSVTPGFLAKVLAVLGPVGVPAYNEVVSAANVAERFNFYTRQVESGSTTMAARKSFVADLAHAVMSRLLSAPASQWDPLAQAIGSAFASGDAMAWSSDDVVGIALARRGWDGALPAVPGDFFYDAEFQYEAKSGRGLRRSYDHRIDLRPDGSARVTTIVTISNTEPRRPLNDKSVIYIALYGPEGAVLDQSSDPPVTTEPSLSGHPAAGWFRSAAPLSKTTLKVVWNVPALATRAGDGSWKLGFHWRRLPDHDGDVLHLAVSLPEGWHFDGAAPPESVDLVRDVVATWNIRP